MERRSFRAWKVGISDDHFAPDASQPQGQLVKSDSAHILLSLALDHLESQL